MYRFPLILLLILLTPLAGHTTPKTPEEVVLALQKQYRHLTSLGFTFTQVTTTGHHQRHGSGTAIFFRPDFMRPRGVMRWDYQQPEPQVIVNDGKEISIYSPADHQVIISPATELESDILYGLLTGTKKVTEDFIILPAATPASAGDMITTGLTSVVLQPRKPHPQIKQVQLWIDGNMLIRRLLVQEHFDAQTELVFDNIAINQLSGHDRAAYKRIIHLELPPDTEIIRP